MRKICFINGSPKNKVSCSAYLIDTLKKMLGEEAGSEEIVCAQSLKQKQTKAAFEKLLEAECLVFVFPLYIDSIPSHLLEFMEEFDQYYKNVSGSNQKIKKDVYAVINNGFIEGTHNKTAADIMKHYSNSLEFNWRFAVGIGAGEFLSSSKDMPLKSKLKRPVYNALVSIIEDILHPETRCEKNFMTNPKMSKAMFIVVGSMHWIITARKNKVRFKKLWKKPYSGLVSKPQR